ncbi:MAG: hypothetical protein JWQ89_2628 [Devosia sp.]|uniref:hypothetical protein n=1 Tax=Devosia sp. TaxID=1871048 RepID=UPI00262ED7B4|nr:hypothetical protein [Devosia sp.]MDB5540901.1 hypothetical protein [Devosia sp.]
MKALAIGLSVLATACSTPAVRTITVEKKVPVPVPCVAKADIPVEPGPVGILPPDARNAADVLAAKLNDVRGWGHKQAALLIGCTSD